ncbi:hypothetical protein Tco_0004982 [Tanacetum coccineum]
MALTGVEQDDWSIEFDAEHMHFGQDGLDDFDWSNKADDAPVSLALMATNSEVTNSPNTVLVKNLGQRDLGTKGAMPEDYLQDYAINDMEALKLQEIKDKIIEKVYLCGRAQVNLLSVSQICDKKHHCLFTDKNVLILSPNSSMLMQRQQRKSCPMGTEDWGIVNFKKDHNKLVKGNLVIGLPSKTFKLDHSCVSYRKGKQHKKGILQRRMRKELSRTS